MLFVRALQILKAETSCNLNPILVQYLNDTGTPNPYQLKCRGQNDGHLIGHTIWTYKSPEFGSQLYLTSIALPCLKFLTNEHFNRLKTK